MDPVPHKPSRKKAIIFFVFTLLLAGSVIVWTFFINKGILIVEGQTPFSVKINSSETLCAAAPCYLKLTPRAYNIVFSKQGFFDDSRNVKIKLWSETKVAANFKFIPTYREAGKIILPDAAAPLRPPFLDMIKFENFPKNIKQADFSPSGNFVLIALGKEFYVYDIADGIIEKTDLKPEMHPAWLGEQLVFFEESSEKQFLKLRSGKENKLLASFERPFKNPTIFGSPDGKKVLIAEKSEESFFYYLVDIEKKSRRRLEISSSAKSPKWTGDFIIFEEGKGDSEKIFAVNVDNFQKTDLAAESSGNVIEKQDGVFIFISPNKQDSSQIQLGSSITEALEQASKDTANIINETTSWFVTEFNVKTNESKMLVEIPAKKNATPHNLTADLTGKKLYLEMDNVLIEITLEL